MEIIMATLCNFILSIFSDHRVQRELIGKNMPVRAGITTGCILILSIRKEWQSVPRMSSRHYVAFG